MNFQMDYDELLQQMSMSNMIQQQSQQKFIYKSHLNAQDYNTTDFQQDIHDYFSDQYLINNFQHSFSFHTKLNQQNHDKIGSFSENSQIIEKKQNLIQKKQSQPQKQSQVQQSIKFLESKQKLSDSYRNQTKNIPKNFGKAIISFIQRQKNITRKVLQKYKSGKYKQLMEYLQNNRKQIISIADVRGLWIDNQYEKVLRVLSELFLRKYSLRYIFNSRITNHNIHIKYKERFLKALRDPSQFKCIKQY